MGLFKRAIAVVLIAAFSFFAFSAKAGAADDTVMQTTFKDTIYGGLIGALIGSAVVLLSENPGEHLNYIPTGAAVGMIVGAVYGLATSGEKKSIVELQGGRFTAHVPAIRVTSVYDRNTNARETTQSVGIFTYRF